MPSSWIQWIELFFGSTAIASVLWVMWVAIKNNPQAIEQQVEARRRERIHRLLDRLPLESTEYWQVLTCLAPDAKYDPAWEQDKLTLVPRLKDWQTAPHSLKKALAPPSDPEET